MSIAIIFARRIEGTMRVKRPKYYEQVENYVRRDISFRENGIFLLMCKKCHENGKKLI